MACVCHYLRLLKMFQFFDCVNNGEICQQASSLHQRQTLRPAKVLE